jgi:hypothetical protein
MLCISWLLCSRPSGCLTQLRSHFAKFSSPLPLHQTIQILRDAYEPRTCQS